VDRERFVKAQETNRNLIAQPTRSFDPRLHDPVKKLGSPAVAQDGNSAMLPALFRCNLTIPEMKEIIMLRSIVRISSFFAVVLAASLVLAQAEFSAEVVDLQ
jgi:hypothetical protein